MKNKRILLVGGAGFIGHHLALRLKSLGADVHIVDSCLVNNLIQHQDNKLYRGFILDRLDLLREKNVSRHWTDARDYHLLSKVVRETKPEIVIHLAAVAHANKSNKDPHNTFDHSLRTLENTLDASIKTSVRQIIYFSSSMVYGDFEEESATETSSLSPKGIYGALKVSGELIVRSYNEVFGLPYTIIRPSALYGERCVSRRIVQVFIENFFSGQDLVISGDGKEKLDFTYIEDLVDGVCLCVGNEKAYDQTFNITYGEGRSINDVVAILNDVLRLYGCVRAKYQKRDKLIPFRGTLDISLAKELLGYSPKFSLEKGMGKYIGWYRDVFSKG